MENILLDENRNPHCSSVTGNATCLHPLLPLSLQCARHDNVFAAEILIEKGLNVNLQDEDLWTALHVACACDHADMVLLLLLMSVILHSADRSRQDQDFPASLDRLCSASTQSCQIAAFTTNKHSKSSKLKHR
ncbi:Unconventional myosin-XVI [Anabarilius grahami]|uniref:Unconventional myosin-XVI n=1 Tax=Anabarilius grahami TaxID=495550 RepID=A0A3N0Z377_ANAGA|nr:Unconventional myosin-XVI [Anabarilius grahami]